MSTQQVATADPTIKTQTNTQNGNGSHTIYENSSAPVYWQSANAKSATQYQNGFFQNGTVPRGYVSLPDFEPELIPLHELPTKPWWPDQLPDHTQLPDSDDEMKNFFEHPQSILITTSMRPLLDHIHPDRRYRIGQDTGVYWEWLHGTDPLDGKKAPDWFYIPDVDPTLTRSYVLWQELVPPLIVIEFVSGDGRNERDNTFGTGKFWVYETAIQPQYYAIYTEQSADVEVYEHVNGQYQQIQPNMRGHYPIAAINIELGIWHGSYSNYTTDWLRIWDDNGHLLLSAEERAEQEAQRAQQEAQRAEQEAQRAQQEAQRAEQEAQRAQQEAQRANEERQARESAEDENVRLRALLEQHGLLP
ncbi:MAG: Uma2 family endonuclease [Chloroflexota bacterium]